MMSEYLSSISDKPEDVRRGISEMQEELEFIAILVLGILALLIWKPLGAVVQFVRNLRER